MALPCIVAVPARLESSRLPDKVMAEIGGKPVLERCGLATAPAAMLLCTDRPDLAASAASWGFDAILTSSACESGIERIASVADQLLVRGCSSESASTLIINVQGDQPFIDPAVIDAMAAEFNRRSPIPEVLTPFTASVPRRYTTPTWSKTLLAVDGRALYFSRSAVPHVRDIDPVH